MGQLVKLGDSLLVDVHVSDNCGFCTKQIHVGHTVSEEPVPVVLHTHPPCDDFMRIESPTDFLAARRKKLGLPDLDN